MPAITLPAVEVLQQIDQFDTIIDARSEAEHALDHVPGALNWPSLNNEERILIGTMYKQVNPFEAKKRGAAIAARNIAAHIEREVIDKPKDWRPLVYCWRGGNRSGALATILGAIGFRVTLIEGGYKAWRAAMVDDIPARARALRYRVICGPTGSGKTRLLQSLAARGEQVLDLEALARHRSSVLGHLPGQPQPSQKRFDSLVWQALRRMDPSRVVYVESESKKVGNLRVPDALMECMRSSECVDLQLSDTERVALLLEDYAHFSADNDLFCRRLEALTELRGKAAVADWCHKVHRGETPAVVMELLTTHYDPMYRQSINKNFVRFPQAVALQLPDRQASSMDAAALTLIRSERESMAG